MVKKENTWQPVQKEEKEEEKEKEEKKEEKEMIIAIKNLIVCSFLEF